MANEERGGAAVVIGALILGASVLGAGYLMADATEKAGDRIVSIDGEAVEWFSDLVRIVSVQPETLLKIKVRRGDDEFVLTATPKRHQH